MHKVLSLIIEAKKKKIAILNKSEKEIVSLAAAAPKPLPFAKILREEEGLSIIAEIKQASPSSGILRQDFNHLQILKDYEEAGARAISASAGTLTVSLSGKTQSYLTVRFRSRPSTPMKSW